MDKFNNAQDDLERLWGKKVCDYLSFSVSDGVVKAKWKDIPDGVISVEEKDELVNNLNQREANQVVDHLANLGVNLEKGSVVVEASNAAELFTHSNLSAASSGYSAGSSTKVANDCRSSK
ncbi:hypothetical protein SUGI_0488900 [Cryptomeria japonica]|nr:hypothetical protein SUGI_0488900 [Cryptomeria japonica]